MPIPLFAQRGMLGRSATETQGPGHPGSLRVMLLSFDFPGWPPHCRPQQAVYLSVLFSPLQAEVVASQGKARTSNFSVTGALPLCATASLCRLKRGIRGGRRSELPYHGKPQTLRPLQAVPEPSCPRARLNIDSSP